MTARHKCTGDVYIMKITLIREPKGRPRKIDVRDGITVAEICDGLEDIPYTILCAKVDNKLVALDFELNDGSRVELLDMRTQAANLIYQASLSLIYLKAVGDIMGSVNVEIMNSINKGLYTEVRSEKEPTESQIRRISERMRDMIEADLPFKSEIVSREAALRYLTEDDRPERKRLIESAPQVSKIRFFELDGYRDFFYSYLVPSTGYIKYFELRKYRRGILLRFPHPSQPDVIPEYVDECKLYQAFEEQTEWDRLLGVNYVSDLNDKIASDRYRDLIQLSEALHEKKVAQIADMIKQRNKRIVLIAGPSSSGKTTFAMRLCVQLRVNGLDPLYLGTDDYFVEREDTPLDEHGERDYENLSALDTKLFNSNINDLLKGREVDLPSFDFITGKKKFGRRLTKLKPDQPIVIEGIHGLNERLTEQLPRNEKFKIYVSPLTQLNIDSHNRIPTTDERMLRRLVRDYRFRGHSANDTIKTWPKVRAGEDVNIFPYSGEADVLFNSYHVYEIAVLCKYAEPLLKEIKPEQAEYAEATRILQLLEFFRTIDEDSFIVNNSIIREFIGGSVFVS